MTGICKKCAKHPIFTDGYCMDCWPGYNLCADESCDHYRCEHMGACANAGCKCTEFVEGATRRVVTVEEFAEMKKSWGLE